jgi:hypothetical protein
MKVKVGNHVYDANEEPIMLILTDEDKQLINEMSPEATKYCAFPDGYPREKVIKWMRNIGDL